jgi:hypothetical protein
MREIAKTFPISQIKEFFESVEIPEEPFWINSYERYDNLKLLIERYIKEMQDEEISDASKSIIFERLKRYKAFLLEYNQDKNAVIEKSIKYENNFKKKFNNGSIDKGR